MDNQKWAKREAAAISGVVPILRALGTWVGAGQSDGVDVVGELIVALSGGGGFVEFREVLMNEVGKVFHDDLAVYYFDPDSHGVRATHFEPVGIVTVRYVELSVKGWRWVAGPDAPVVEFIFGESARDVDVLTISVTVPSGEISHLMTYTKPSVREKQ